MTNVLTVSTEPPLVLTDSISPEPPVIIYISPECTLTLYKKDPPYKILNNGVKYVLGILANVLLEMIKISPLLTLPNLTNFSNC